MICLAMVYQKLAIRRPDLDNGIYAYAKAGFGDFIGFNSAWGYWLSALIGNVGYLVCLLYTSPSPRDRTRSRMPSSA